MYACTESIVHCACVRHACGVANGVLLLHKLSGCDNVDAAGMGVCGRRRDECPTALGHRAARTAASRCWRGPGAFAFLGRGRLSIANSAAVAAVAATAVSTIAAA